MYLLKTFFIGDKILRFLFIIFVACLVCFNSIFTTYAIFPYIRRNSALLCIIWWKIFNLYLNVYDFVEQLYFFKNKTVTVSRIVISLIFFTVRIIESTCSQVGDMFIEKVVGLKTAASTFILNILINAKRRMILFFKVGNL